ncbi:hypothetical protein DPMN_054559 [Dreissena polymorpha]|uniref:Uncharacterized protein n=1 Tax=Dreissena polymorpha TaxID=45954 RepID=A0A9D4CQX4_DREPO|nr:hypothetical protein DPMN_054559 [Dreissena polymorpha]
MSFLHPSVTNVVSESTTPSPDMNTTYVIVTSYPTSPLHRCIRNKCKCNKCVSRNYCLYRRKPVKRLQNKRYNINYYPPDVFKKPDTTGIKNIHIGLYSLNRQ